MSRRAPALLLLILASLSPLPVAAMELGPPARNLQTFRENDAGYMSFGYSFDSVDMKERTANRYTAPGVRDVKRQMTYVSMAWLPSDRVEMDIRFGMQGMKVGNGFEVEGRVIDGASRLAGFGGGGLRVLAYENPDAGVRFGWIADGSVTVFRWNDQQESFRNSSDNLVSVDLRYGEYFEARTALAVSKVFRFATRETMDTMSPRELASDGGLDWPLPEVTALEIYGGPFARAAYMYGNLNAYVGDQNGGYTRFHLLQNSVAGAFAGVRGYVGRTHRWSLGLEGRYQSGLSLSFLVDTTL